MMVEQSVSRRYFSIKWQAFALTSVVLAVICVAFLFFISESTQRQFEQGRSHVYDQNRQQLDSLIEVAADKMIQFANTATLYGDLRQALEQENSVALDRELEALSWSLQLDAGIEDISVFNRYGRNLSAAGHPASQQLVLDILESEAPQWRLSCRAKCYVEGGTPVLGRGEVVGVIVLSEPLSNVMLRFRHIANIDTGLLVDKPDQEDFGRFIPGWQKNLVALTNPEDSRAIIQNAATLYSLKELEEGTRLIDINNEVFELRSLPIKDSQVVVISNVSEDLSNMEKSRSESIRISIASLVIAEGILLILLWRPMARLRKTTRALPLLAEGRFHDLRVSLNQLGGTQIFNDESDILNVTAMKLSNEFETLQAQLERRACEIEDQGKALDKERDFVNQLLDTVHAIIMVQDESGRIQVSNKYAVRLSGYSARELRGARFTDLLAPGAESEGVAARIQDVVDGALSDYQHECALITRDGGRLNLAWRHAVLFDHDSRARQVLSVAVDVSARIKAESELAWLANHDTLSGLYNRYRFDEELRHCLAAFKSGYLQFGLALVDLDGLKALNETHGRQLGDELIQMTASQLRAVTRESDFLARMAGDQFAVIIRDAKPESIRAMANAIQESLAEIKSRRSVGPDGLIACSASIGLAIMNEDTASLEQLLVSADQALFKAKKQGLNQLAECAAIDGA